MIGDCRTIEWICFDLDESQGRGHPSTEVDWMVVIVVLVFFLLCFEQINCGSFRLVAVFFGFASLAHFEGGWCCQQHAIFFYPSSDDKRQSFLYRIVNDAIARLNVLDPI
jgi:hypothetical protein